MHQLAALLEQKEPAWPLVQEWIRSATHTAEVQPVHGGRALSIYPFLWAAGPPVGERSRRPIPVEEIYGLQQDLTRQTEGKG